MSDTTPTTDPSIGLLVQAAAFVQAMEPRADSRPMGCPLWHGWAIREAWLAGYAAAQAEVQRLQGIIAGLAERVAGQSDLLAKRAESGVATRSASLQTLALADCEVETPASEKASRVKTATYGPLYLFQDGYPANVLYGMAHRAPFYIHYRNHRGEVAWRRIEPRKLHFGECEWHKGECWLLDAIDLDKGEVCTFTLQDMLAWSVEPPFESKECKAEAPDREG